MGRSRCTTHRSNEGHRIGLGSRPLGYSPDRKPPRLGCRYRGPDAAGAFQKFVVAEWNSTCRVSRAELSGNAVFHSQPEVERPLRPFGFVSQHHFTRRNTARPLGNSGLLRGLSRLRGSRRRHFRNKEKNAGAGVAGPCVSSTRDSAHHIRPCYCSELDSHLSQLSVA